MFRASVRIRCQLTPRQIESFPFAPSASQRFFHRTTCKSNPSIPPLKRQQSCFTIEKFAETVIDLAVPSSSSSFSSSSLFSLFFRWIYLAVIFARYQPIHSRIVNLRKLLDKYFVFLRESLSHSLPRGGERILSRLGTKYPYIRRKPSSIIQSRTCTPFPVPRARFHIEAP